MLWRTEGESSKLPFVDEGRKRVLLIAASILAARKLAQFDGGKRVPATVSAIADAVRWAYYKSGNLLFSARTNDPA